MRKNIAEDIRVNISLYFPFLVYYRISYYQSNFFPLQSMWNFARRGLLPAGATGSGAATSDSPGSVAPAGVLTVRALLWATIAAADLNSGITSPSTTFAALSVESWLMYDWPSMVRSGWPLFGALALLRGTAWPLAPSACSERAHAFELELRRALDENEVVAPAASLLLLDGHASGIGGMVRGECARRDAVLRAAAHVAMADWVRRAEAQDATMAAAAVDAELRQAQAVLQASVSLDCGNTSAAARPCQRPGSAGLGALVEFPGGEELLWLLDRLHCQPVIDMVVREGRRWLGAENIGMRSDVRIAYKLAVFPHRELVSDFVRARGVPYCNESILRVIQRLARRLQAAGASRVRVVEVGANLGDCVLWAVQRLRAVPGLRDVRAVAVEASPAAAALLERSVRLNGLEGSVRVVNVAASAPGAPGGGGPGYVRLLAKPRSSNSFTDVTGSQGSPRDGAVEVPAVGLDEVVGFSGVELLINHVNGQELGVLRGARRLLARSRAVAIVSQVYGPDAGVVRARTYNPDHLATWLTRRGYDVTVARRPGRRFRSPGALHRYFARTTSTKHTFDILATPRRTPRRTPTLRGALRPPRTAAGMEGRACTDLAAGERPRSWVEVDGRVLRENLHLLRLHLDRAHGGSGEAPPRIGVVLKANAYGHGAVLAGRVLASARVDALLVSEVDTALQLRASPEVPFDLPIVLLYVVPDDAVVCVLAAANVTVSVLSRDWLERALRWPPCGVPLRLHLMVDTGLMREGVAPSEALQAARAILGSWPHLLLDGIYTHWCCPYDPGEMRRAKATFEEAVASVAALRRGLPGAAGGAPLTVHASSSSTVLYGAGYDLLRVGGLLFGDPVALVDEVGERFTMPGLHRTLLWKSTVTALHRTRPGRRYAPCTEPSGCLTGPLHHEDALLGVVPVGGSEFSHTAVLGAAHRERLPLLEKATDALVVQIPRDTRTYRGATVGMEVLLCEESCVQGLFNVPEHVPRILVNDPSITLGYFCPRETALVLHRLSSAG